MKYKFKVNKTLARYLFESNSIFVPSMKHIEIEHYPYSPLYYICLSGMRTFVFNACSGYFAETYYDEDLVHHYKYICTVKGKVF